jgi:class 3 adenylate cyclase
MSVVALSVRARPRVNVAHPPFRDTVPKRTARTALVSSSGRGVGSNLRKTVAVLFCDLTGSTAFGETLDPERPRALLARYFERMKALVERHGGSLAKFIGDAVMAMFGVPLLHEDNALRAVRSAVEMRDALPELGLQAGRCSSRSRRRSP